MSRCRGKFAFGADEWPGVAKLVEECGELLQVTGKLLMVDGATDHWSGNLRTMFVEELADVRAAALFVTGRCLTEAERAKVEARIVAKSRKFCLWHAEPEDDIFVPGGSKLVIIESPFAGEVEENTAYARAAMRDSIGRGENPIASHLLYTQPGILDDNDPQERQRGIDAGLAWRRVADRAVFYIDRGWSGGMLAAREVYEREGFPFEERSL